MSLLGSRARNGEASAFTCKSKSFLTFSFNFIISELASPFQTESFVLTFFSNGSERISFIGLENVIILLASPFQTERLLDLTDFFFYSSSSSILQTKSCSGHNSAPFWS